MQHVCGVGRVGTGPMKYTFNFRDIWTQWDYIAEGIGVTLLLAVVTMIAGLTIGALGAAARVYGRPWLGALVAGYVEVIRNTPLLVQLFIVFFGLPSARRPARRQ